MRVAIENCPMLFGPDQWPGGQNLMTTPAIWRKVFERLPSPNLGINYDPSHFVWQMMDYIQPIYEFKDKIFHVHYKDIKLFPEKLRQVGTMAYPLDYMSPKLPGLGDVDWGRYVSALTDIWLRRLYLHRGRGPVLRGQPRKSAGLPCAFPSGTWSSSSSD